MAEVIVYSSNNCSYCVRAKQLLANKNVEFKELRVDLDAALRDEMIEKSGRRTVPQIFIDGKHIGGFDDLYSLDSKGELDSLLG